MANTVFKFTPELIDKLDKVAHGRFSKDYIAQYNQYDPKIEQVKEQFPDANLNLIKGIMAIETGFLPRKNSLGYEGFPQTNQTNITAINERYKTHFTLKDMYDPYQSAVFIYYYAKDISRSSYVTTDEEILISYNWGQGNLKKYKAGEKSLPKETSDYVGIYEVLKSAF